MAKSLEEKIKEFNEFCAVANRISDRFVQLMGEEFRNGANPLEILAGHTLALLSYSATAPIEDRPEELTALFNAARALIEGIAEPVTRTIH